MTPEQQRREARRDAGVAFLILACVIVVVIVGVMLAVAWVEGRL